MITVQELLDSLAYGEMHNLKLGNSEFETIMEKDYPRVINALNMALFEVYSRINLREGTIKLHQHASVTRYYLRSEYAETSDNMDDEYYLEQTDDLPFQDDVIKIVSAKDSEGKKVRINDPRYPADIFTPEFDVIELAAPSSAEAYKNADGTNRTAVDTFTIKYQAKYPKIVLDQRFDASTYKLYIPDAIHEALLIFMAYRLLRKPVKVAKGEIHPQQSLLLEFENQIKKLKDMKIAIEPDPEDRNRFDDNGWI